MKKLLRKFRKNKEETQNKLKKAKSTTLKLSLIMLNFIFATFAWFTYTMILETSVDVNVSAWKIDFKDNTGSLGNAMQFQVGNFYPGMADYSKEIEILNLGDRATSISYEIDTLEILGHPYTIQEITAEEPAEENATEGEEEVNQNILYKSETIDANRNESCKTIK